MSKRRLKVYAMDLWHNDVIVVQNRSSGEWTVRGMVFKVWRERDGYVYVEFYDSSIDRYRQERQVSIEQNSEGTSHG